MADCDGGDVTTHLITPLDVIIVDYHCPMLDAGLASLGQLGPDSVGTVHVVDNGGTTDWDRVTQRVEGLGGRLAAHHFRENVGFGAGVNRALAHVESSYVLLLNPDARLTDADLGPVDASFAAADDLGLVGPEVRLPDGDVEATGGRLPSVRGSLRRLVTGTTSWRVPFGQATGVQWVSGVAMVARAEALRAVGGFDERYFLYYEDVDLCRRLALAGWRIGTTDAIKVEHSRAGTPTSSWRRTMHQRLGLVRFLVMPPKQPGVPSDAASPG